ncbi:MAG: hypothetical protein ACJ77Z_19375, partial [Thermoleophilaceae bacterium]
MVDDALGVGLERPGLAEVAARQVGDRQTTVVVAPDAGERAGQELEPRERQVLVEAAVDGRDVDAGLDVIWVDLVVGLEC